MFLLYNLFIVLLAPIWVPWMMLRARKRAEPPNWKERTGDYRHIDIPKGARTLWIHAVSVGEVMAALPILRQTKALLPGHHLVLSVTTSSGHRTAQEHAADLYDSLVYFPIDVPRFQLSAMMRIKPDVVAIMETELWFNFLWAAKAMRAKTMLINGRISERSFARSSKVRFFYKALLAQMDRCLMQTDGDADRIKALGGRNVEVFGNCKFDQAVDGLDADPDWWRANLGISEDRLCLVIGSTRGDEEERFVFEALSRLDASELNVVWAPRHLERADDLEAQMKSAFGECARRSRAERGPYVLLDTYGELAKAYSVADIVIIGGGFADLGGQNLLQALAHGKPVIHGPHMRNFRDVADEALKRGASQTCTTPLELATAIAELSKNPEERARMGTAGRAFVIENEGASRKYAEAIADATR